MNNLNEYNEDKFCQEFEYTDIAQTAKKEFDQLCWHKTNRNLYSYGTPRKIHGTVNQTRFSMVPFYYLQPLIEKNPKEIYDLGCGWNIFKKFIPQIIGVSPEQGVDFFGDIFDIVDDNYIKGHQNYFESVFSINALHFRPLDKLRQSVYDFISMVKPGGRGFLAVNLQRYIDQTSKEYLTTIFGTAAPSKVAYDSFVRDALSTIGINFLIIDIDFNNTLNDGMDGNIRLVFEK